MQSLFCEGGDKKLPSITFHVVSECKFPRKKHATKSVMKIQKTTAIRSSLSIIKSSLAFSCLTILLPTSLSAASIFTIDFDNDGDTEGFTGLNVSSLAASGGFLTGTATSGDPRLESSTELPTSPPLFSLSVGETWSTISFRVRETDESLSVVTSFTPGGLVFLLNENNTSSGAVTFGSSGITGVDSGDGFFTVSADISTFTPSEIRYLRLDPIGLGDANNNQFEVDFVRLTTVPEPSIALLGALGMFGLVRRRR